MASALSALDWFGQRGDLNEKDMIALRQPNTQWGGFTSLAQLISVFRNAEKAGVTGKWKLQSSFDDPYKLFDPAWVKATLAGGSPIMVGWNSWGAHWQVIIGYDDMGTEGTNDDVLILMDPYDSTDQDNDGYTHAVLRAARLRRRLRGRRPERRGRVLAHQLPGRDAGQVALQGRPRAAASVRDKTNVGDFSDDHKIPYGDAADDLAHVLPRHAVDRRRTGWPAPRPAATSAPATTTTRRTSSSSTGPPRRAPTR